MIDNVTVANNRRNEPAADDNAFFDVIASDRSSALEKESSQEDYRASISRLTVVW